MHRRTIERSLRLLSLEMIVTSIVMAMPILTVYFNSLGMSLEQVGLSQAAFTVGVLLFNIPSGHLADTFGRKKFNVIGDTVAALAFAYYACIANTFVDVVVVEFVLGIALALSGGVDVSLFEAYCVELGYTNWEKRFAKVNGWRLVAEAGGVVMGGIIGAYSPRIAIAMSILTYGMGALLSLGLVDAGERRCVTETYRQDLWRVLRYTLHENRLLRWSVIANAFAREVTHPTVWILTPILLMAGVPAEWLGVGWAMNMAAAWWGNRFAQHHSHRFNDWQKVMIVVIAVALPAVTLALIVQPYTIWLFGVFGFVRGWSSSAIVPIVQKHSPADIKTSVSSVSGTVANILYIPLVWWMGALGDISPQATMGGVVLVSLCGLVPTLALKKIP